MCLSVYVPMVANTQTHRHANTYFSMEKEIKKQLKNWSKLVRKYQKPDTRKAVFQLLNTFVPFIALWVLMYWSLSWSYWITIGLAMVNAGFLVRIFIIQHDCGHQSFLKSRAWNNTIGFLCSFFSTIPYKYWAAVHNHHHTHTGILEHRDIGDIDFLTVEEYRKRSKWGKFKYRVFRNPVILFGFVPVIYLAISNRIPALLSIKKIKDVAWNQVFNNLAMAGVYIGLCYWLGWKAFVAVQVPIVVAFMIIAFWFFYVQHQHEETYMRWQKNWDYVLAAIRGATYYKLPKVLQWFTGNIGFHHIHHLSSQIPNYNLAQCQKDNPILEKFVTVITLRDSFKIALNKLWDEETKRMITFAEYHRLMKLRYS